MPGRRGIKDRKLLQDFLTSLANLSDLTVELMDRQLVFVRQLAVLGPRYQEASKRADFWKNAVVGLEPEEVASLFFNLGRITELGNQLSKFATLKPDEQDRLIKDYKETTKALDGLRDKLKQK